MFNWKTWTGRMLAILIIACWSWLIIKAPIPAPFTKLILAGIIIGIVLIASYLQTRASFWVKSGFVGAIALLVALLTHGGVTMQLWNLFVVAVLLVLLPVRERRPWWPAMKRTVERLHETPSSEEKKLEKVLGRRGA